MSKKREHGLEYRPTAGVRTDFKRFMNKFLSNNTVRYEHFSEVWRERNMSYLCAGRGTDREAREFIERVTMIAQEYFLPPYQFQVRVGGLYMLYAIYQVQPLIPKVKLRLTPTQWQDTMYFQQQAAQQNHLDVVYVFQRLLQEQAFLFCYTPSEMSIHSHIKDVEDREENHADNLREEKTAVVNLFNYESLEKLSYVQDQYQQMKIGLAGQNATKPDKSLDVVQGELTEDIVVLLQAFKEKVATFSKQSQRTEGTNQEKEPAPETTGSRRQQLKTQAYSQLTAAHPDKRHNLVVLNNSTPPKAKAKNSEAGDATNLVQTGSSRPVTKESQRPVLNVSDSSSTDDTDDEYIPPRNLNSDSSRQTIRDKRKGPLKGTAARDRAKVMKQVTRSSLYINDLNKSHNSMPVLALEDIASVCPVPTKKQRTSIEREVHTTKLYQNIEHCSENTKADLAAPVRKRGRPPISTYRNSNEMNVSEVGLKTQLHQHDKENPSQANKISNSVGKSNDMSNIIILDQDQISLQNKVAFKWKGSGKANQFAVGKSPPKTGNILEKNATVSTAPVRKRGRPRMCFDPTQPIPEIIVYPKQALPQESTPASKYEMLYFPAGFKLTPDLKGAAKLTSHLDESKIADIIQQMTHKTRQTKKNSSTKMTTTIVKKINESANQEPMSKTVTEDTVSNAVKKPAVIQSPNNHKTVNNPGHSKHTSASGDIHSTEQNNLSQQVKLMQSTKQSADNAIQRLKERCKRQLEESETDESVGKFVKRCMTGVKYSRKFQSGSADSQR